MTSIDQLYSRLPHAGAMCLLDKVINSDRNSVRCSASSHRRTDNPLRTGGVLPSVCALEYAAQAFALHSLLIADESVDNAPDSSRVFIALVKAVELYTDRIDDCQGELLIDGQVLLRQANSVVYHFEVSAGDRHLLSGQIGLMS